ncbi:uncharacterized protein I206_102579 [Kwoniella pini CBS 10737]|uniref:FAD-binding FR-type domain-containing protein n=1 Tax=Kwoniella pini CBS 10737 TaxID=1296096 RepID=A0A1B9I5S7_9TREE|nr:uncharacterized protein I206_02930 [Kwoniella pini CBS 10737]OCF50872.1 hypothetical protein I206_02930 [Kwoniella pini CBS 10737]
MSIIARFLPLALLFSSASFLGVRGEGLQISLKNPVHNCVLGINDALTEVSFGDMDLNATYYGRLCGSEMFTTSMALSVMKWCNTHIQIESGHEGFSNYCEKYGETYLPSWEEILKKVNQSNVIENVNTIDPEIMGTVFNSTIVISEEAFKAGKRTEDVWTTEENYHHGFGWGLYILVGMAILVGTLNRLFAFLVQKYATPYNASELAPRSPGIRGKLYTLYRKHIEVPALFGYKHSQASAWGMLSLPTRLQGLFIFTYVVLNIVFTVVGYEIFHDNLYWYGQRDTQIIRYLSDRTGIMCFYNLPLLWCLAGRNDVILWLTGWSYSTLNLFHRWVARIAVLQAIVHSAGYTWLERDIIATEMKERYWWTGIIATIVMSLLIPFSIRPFREKFYEAFLIIHICLALVTLVACWYHVQIWDGQYDPWIWASVGVWAMDRFIRVIRVGILTNKALFKKGTNAIGTIPNLNENGLIRLSISTSIKINPKPGQYFFIYTPFSIKPWENHPFTLASWKFNEKNTDTTILNFLIKPLKGQTKKWQKEILKNQGKLSFKLFLEGPYGHENFIENFDKILFISGGSGITSILPYIFKLNQSSLILLPEFQIKEINLIWIIKNEEYAKDILSNELKEYIELGFCGSIPFKIHLYVTRENQNHLPTISSSIPQEIVNSLAYGNGNGTSLSRNAELESGSTSPNHTSTAIMNKVEIINEKPSPQSHSSSSDLSHSSPDLKDSKNKSMTIHCGKPHVRDIIDRSVNSLVGAERLAVSACGPSKLMDDTRASVCDIYGNNEGQLGGRRIEYFEELFAW